MKKKYFVIGDEELEILEIGPRNELTPLPGVTLIGNAVIVRELDGSKSALCEWDGEIIERDEKNLHAEISALSDEFQSTFSHPAPGILMNMFHESEKELVADLVRKHLKVENVTVEKARFKDEPYALWLIKYE